MGYGRFMGYAMHFPENQLGGPKMLWDKRDYRFIEVWVKRGSTVLLKYTFNPHPLVFNSHIKGLFGNQK